MLLFQEWGDGGGRGECTKMEIGCSEVNVMVQNVDMMNRSFFMTRKDIQILVHMSGHTDTRSYVKRYRVF